MSEARSSDRLRDPRKLLHEAHPAAGPILDARRGAAQLGDPAHQREPDARTLQPPFTNSQMSG